MKFTKFEEQVFLTTTLIENIVDKEFGTGFFVQKKVDDKSSKILLFSNKHVFWGKKDKNKSGIEKTIKIVFHKKQGEEYKPGNVKEIKLAFKRNQKGYYEHPDPDIDVACINISKVYSEISAGTMFLELEKFIDFDFEKIYAGQKILFVGYPKGFFDTKNFLPVARSGSIASIPSIDFEGRKQLLIDAQVFPGSSGSPVFAVISGQYKLLGIISEAPVKPLDFLDVPVEKSTKSNGKKNENEISIPIQFIGLGMLFKSGTIKEVFDLA